MVMYQSARFTASRVSFKYLQLTRFLINFERTS
jgi:hypothetical protein